ncbi:MAG TPA: sigma-70 family RNA polymerase sigma factor [Firmicutes bacterium]|nr:sigma-70 family RNA polymerase sigma factor [Candidatus Fermentithermobacillaceae bacterium]
MSLRPNLEGCTDSDLVSLALGESPDGSEVDDAVVTEAFEILMKRHYGSVAKVVYAALGSTSELEDVLQSAFLAAFRSLGSLQDRSKFKYWIRTIAVNQARDVTRRHTRYEEVGSLEELITLPERPDDIVELFWQLEEIARRLPPAYMQVLYLRYYLGYSVKDVAGLLGIDPGLVKWRTNRARKLASQILRDPAPAGGDHDIGGIGVSGSGRDRSAQRNAATAGWLNELQVSSREVDDHGQTGTGHGNSPSPPLHSDSSELH